MNPDYYREMAEYQGKHWWYEGRRRILKKVIQKLKLPEHAKILEAGCGPGANLNMLKEFGDLDAFEPESYAVMNAADISGIDVREGSIPESFPFDETTQYDLIGAFDVVEHIADDLGAIRILHQHTKNYGYAVFTVPAHPWLWSEHDDINQHKRRYTKLYFRQTLEAAGYKVQYLSFYNMWLFPLAVSVRMIKKALRIRTGASDVKKPGGPVNAILRMIFASEKLLIPSMKLPFGLSLIAICKKEQQTHG